MRVAAIAATVIAGSGAAQKIVSSPAPDVRGIRAIPQDQPAEHGHHYVVAIGINRYRNWPILDTAVNDATGFAKLLHDQFGFEFAAEPLTEEKATRENISALIDDDLRAKLQPEDDLIVFFAGHGTARLDRIGDGETKSVGFIVPVEARAPGKNEHWSDYLSLDEFLHSVSTLPPAHILVILDSCRSGIALGNTFIATRGDTRFEKDIARKISRKVIASAQRDQLAADGGPLRGHSLFTGLMMQGLLSGKADVFQEGFITSTQLGAFTQHEVAVSAESRQTPVFGSFDLDEGGELIIPLGSGTVAASGVAAGGGSAVGPSVATAMTNLESMEIVKMRKDGRYYWRDDDPLKNFPRQEARP